MTMRVQLYRFKRAEISSHIVTSRERVKPLRKHSQGHNVQSFEDPDYGDWGSISKQLGKSQRYLSLAFDQISLGVGGGLSTHTYKVLTKERFEDLHAISTEAPMVRAIDILAAAITEQETGRQHGCEAPLRQYSDDEVQDYKELLTTIDKEVDWDREIIAAIMV